MKNNKKENEETLNKDDKIYKEIYSIWHGFHQNEIVGTYKEFFVTKNAQDQYKLWKYDNSSCEMKKVDLKNVCYLEIKDKFLIVYKFIKDGNDIFYSDEIYELPNFNLIIKSNSFRINIREVKDFYIVDEQIEDSNGDLYTKNSRIIDKKTNKEIYPFNINNQHIIRYIHKNSNGSINATIYDYKNESGTLLGANKIAKKGFKNFCEYDDNKILIYDDLEHAKVIDYEGNLIKEIKININLKESEHLILNDFKNGYASYKIYNSRPDFCWYTFLYGIIDLDGNKITPNYEYLYMLNNNKYIFEKDFKFYISDISKIEEKIYIGSYNPKTKDGYILCNDNDNCIFTDISNNKIFKFPFHVEDFNVKDNLVIFKTKKGNLLYNLDDKKEIINCPCDITIINSETIIIDDKIKKIEDLNKKEEIQINEKIDKPKTKFLSRFNFIKRKM